MGQHLTSPSSVFLAIDFACLQAGQGWGAGTSPFLALVSH